MNRLSARARALVVMLAFPAAAAIAAETAPAPAADATAQQAAPEQIDAPPPKPYEMAKNTRDYIRKAVELPDRPLRATIHDAYRKPAEVMQFSNIRPGQRVIELSAYGNYWSDMLSEVLGAKGELHMYDPLFAAPMKPQSEAFVAAHPNTKYQNLDFNNIEFPRGVDLVWCFACFHEILGTGVNLDPFLAKMYKAMKPGARILVVFYTSRDGMENRDVGTLHRLDPGTVRGTIQAAGFQLQEEHRMLQNPQDNKTTPVFTEAEADLSDRTIYRFVKP